MPRGVPNRAMVVMICINQDIHFPAGQLLLLHHYLQTLLPSQRTHPHHHYHQCPHRNNPHHLLYQSPHPLYQSHQWRNQSKIGIERKENIRKITPGEKDQNQNLHLKRNIDQGRSLQLDLFHQELYLLNLGRNLAQFLVCHHIHIGQTVVGHIGQTVVGLYLQLVVTHKDQSQDLIQGQDQGHVRDLTQDLTVDQGLGLIQVQGQVHYQDPGQGQLLLKDHPFQMHQLKRGIERD